MASKFAQVDAKHYSLWRKVLQYIVVYFMLQPFFKVFFKIEVYGRENLPPMGRAFLAASNHSSYFDPFILTLAVKRPVAFMAKEELFHTPIINIVVRVLGAFAVNREKLEKATIKSSKEILLKTDWMLGIFPQGTRIMERKIGKVNKGIGYLAKMANVEIVPVGINLRREKYPFWGKLIVKIGKPIPIPENPEEVMDKWARSVAELADLEYTPEEKAEDTVTV